MFGRRGGSIWRRPDNGAAPGIGGSADDSQCAIYSTRFRAADAVSLRRPRRAARLRRLRRPDSPQGTSATPAVGYSAVRLILRNQGHDLRRTDRSDRSCAARAPRRRQRARGNPRHRQRDHRDQEHRDVDRRAGRTARRHLQRRARLRSARAVAGARRHRRHHGERLRHGLHRSRAAKFRRPASASATTSSLLNICQRIVSQIGRRVDEILADLRRALARRLPRQRDRAAAGDRRACAHHPQVQERQADARSAGQIRHHHASKAPSILAHHRPLPRQHHWCRAAPVPARPRCSIA